MGPWGHAICHGPSKNSTLNRDGQRQRLFISSFPFGVCLPCCLDPNNNHKKMNAREARFASNVQQAMYALMRNPSLRTLQVTVGFRAAQRFRFRAFVVLLERHQCIERIIFVDCYFNENENAIVEGLERLYGVVLPTHPTLKEITFRDCYCIHPQYLELFASSILVNRTSTTNPLSMLEFEYTPLSERCLAAIASLIRQNAPIQQIKLDRFCFPNNRQTGIVNSSYGRILFQGFTAESNNNNINNRHLQTLHISNHEKMTIDGESFVRSVTCSSSSLRDLGVRFDFTNWSMEDYDELLERLKTNVVLERLILGKNIQPTVGRYLFERFRDLLASFNFTLRQVQFANWCWNGVEVDKTREIQRLLAINVHVRYAHIHLQHQNYRLLELKSLWPWVLERIQSKPALVYRFLRHANLDALVSSLCRPIVIVNENEEGPIWQMTPEEMP